MSEMYIGKSKVYKKGDVYRLGAMIKIGSEEKELYYEVSEQYKDYLLWEYADPFVVGLLYFAQSKGYDIVCEQKMSERLYYQLTTYQIPVTAATDKDMHNIKIIAETEVYSDDIRQGDAVGASISGGVDSFYALIKHQEYRERKVTHTMIGNVFGKYLNEEDTRERFGKLVSDGNKLARELGIDVVAVYTNCYDFHYKYFVYYGTLRTCSMALALKKLYKIYYFANSYLFKDFTLEPYLKGTEHFDLFNLQNISDDRLVFYSSGGEMSRADKTEYISDNKIVKKYLHVCNIDSDGNCSKCSKCRRTLLTLWANGNLQEYADCFDLAQFEKDKGKALVEILARRNMFDNEILAFMKKKNFKIPPYMYFLSIWKRISLKFWGMPILRESRLIRKWYYALNIDVLRYRGNRQMVEYFRYEHKE